MEGRGDREQLVHDYKPIVIPGALVTGFTEDVAYIREVA
jgi:hypothetical protein